MSFTKLGNQKGKCPSCWVLLATYSTNKIIVLKRYVSETRRKKKYKEIIINETNSRTETVKEMLEEENTVLIN